MKTINFKTFRDENGVLLDEPLFSVDEDGREYRENMFQIFKKHDVIRINRSFPDGTTLVTFGQVTRNPYQDARGVWRLPIKRGLLHERND